MKKYNKKQFLKQILTEYDQYILCRNALAKDTVINSQYRIEQFLNHKKVQYEKTIDKDRKSNKATNSNIFRKSKIYRRKAKIIISRLSRRLRCF